MKALVLFKGAQGILETYIKIVVCLIPILFPYTSFSQQLAFPTAVGAGAYTTGGRGGYVIKVSNLNDSGPGSLRAALKSTGSRIIVFDVSGTIHLLSTIELGLSNSDFTVAGQSAPQGGITIAGKPIQMGGGYNLPTEPCNNAIWRYIRFRNGSFTGEEDVGDHNGFISTGTVGLIFDHCSFSFCDDQAISMNADWGDLRNITIQRSIFSENATGIIAGLSLRHKSGDMTFINNLFVDQGHRTPNMGGSLRYDIINNVYFNWGSRLANINSGKPRVNYIGNYLKPGSYSNNVITNKVQNASPLIYSSYNFHTKLYTVPQMNDRNLWTYFYNENILNDNYFVSDQFPLLGLNSPVISATDAYFDVLEDVGSNKFLTENGSISEYQDSFDTLKIINVQNNISSNPFNKNWTLPDLPSNTRHENYDSNNDGMPDQWKIRKGFSPDANLQTYEWPSGYIGVEEFLNEIDKNQNSVVNVTANAGEDTTICPGTTTSLIASGGSSYLWSTGKTTASITVSPDETTTYTVTAYDTTGNYSDSDEVTVTVNPLPKVDAGEDVTIEVGEKTTLTAKGADSYLWSTGETTASIEVSPTSTTTYTVTGKEGDCEASDTVTVFSVDASVKANAGEDTDICLGTPTKLTASGGTNYVWSTGETTSEIEVSPEKTTTYTVTVSDDKGQSDEASVTVTVNSSPQANAGEDQTICNGEKTTLTASGGTSYLWSTGETTASIEVNPKADTVYSVEVSNASCSSTDDVSVFVKTAPVLKITGDVIISEGESTTLTVSGGENYEWSTGETTESITVNPKVTTTYSVHSRVESGCSGNASITVEVAQEVFANAGEDIAVCAESSTILTATGGSSYKWSTGATTESIEVSPSDTTTYSVTVYDGTGTNSDTDEVTVSINPLPVIAVEGNVTIDSGESTTLTVKGATSYKWSTGETGESITVSPKTTRTYKVTGIQNGCEVTKNVKVTVANTVEIVADAGPDQSICEGSSTRLTATGSATYKWSTGETTSSIEVNPSSTTTYSVTAYDSTGEYSDTADVKVKVNPLPAVDAGKNVTIKPGESTTLTVKGATSYKWSTGETGKSITVSPKTTRTYKVTGIQNGCEVTKTVKVTVTNTVEIIADAGPDQNICKGSSTRLTATGGATYKWSTGETTPSIEVSPSSTTTYSVTAYDSTGKYSDTDKVKITVNLIPQVDAGRDIRITRGDKTTLTATGAASYKWSTGETGKSITVSPTATKTYTVKGIRNGCEATATVKVTVADPIKVVARAGGNKDVCEGGEVTLTATGGERYLWSTGATTATIKVNPTSTTKYTVTAYIGNVSATDEAIVRISPSPKVSIVNGSEATILEGEFITLSAKGANKYKWSNGATEPNIAVRPTKNSTYKVVGYVNDCSSEKSIKINVFERVVASAGDDVSICKSERAVLTASGPANSEFLWSTGETTKSITVSPDADTEYSVMVYHELDSDTDNVMVKVRNCENAQIGADNPTLEDDLKLEFLIHPNPTYGEVHIKISGLSNDSNIQLYDLSGKSLYKEEISVNNRQAYNKTLDLSNFASGIYLLQLVDNQQVITKKVIVR